MPFPFPPTPPRPSPPQSSPSTYASSPPSSTFTPEPKTYRSPSKSSSIASTSSLQVGDMKRSWQPSEAVPVVRVDERPGIRRGVSASGGKGVERDLTDLFVENAKNMDNLERPKKRVKRGWGWGGMVDTAYSVSVFGAALGLTAYRVISAAAVGEGSDAREYSSSSGGEIRGVRHEEVPPPYEERVGRKKADVGVEVVDGWEEVDDETDIVTPTHSRSSTQTSHRHPSSPSRHKSTHNPYSPSRPPPASIPKSHHRKHSSLSHTHNPKTRTPRTSIYQQPTATVIDDGYLNPILTMPIPSPCLSVSGESVEVVERLDAMGERLRELILEGQRALGEMPALSGGEWVDEG